MSFDPAPFVVHCGRSAYEVFIGRPSKWGNPWSHLKQSHAKHFVSTRTEAIECFERWILGQPELLKAAVAELRGKRLGCYCAPLACHGHVLARIANVE